ncbi:MAG: hypothetical protein P4M15_13890, partial [Alphaproteobacteria bacterium]|nr:hypothetical protein [Alphaproteobacteria bacterium]
MVHKPLVKGRSTSSPAPVNNAKSVERPASPVRSDFRQAHEQVNVNEKAIVDRMIAGLPNLTINPEQVVLEIYAKLGNAYMKASPEMRQQIQEGRLTAHVNYINRLLQEITRHSQPDILLSQIESSRKLLAQYGEEARSFDANGAGIEARIAAAYEERKVIAREKEVKKLVEQVQTNLEELRHYPREADAAYEALVKALDDLGADQARAFPQGVTSREEMDRFIQAAYDAAKVTTARQKFLHFGEAYSGFATPELELAALRKTVATVLGGDATKLVIDPKTAAQMEEEIDQRFCGAMERMASDMLDRNDISGGLRVLFMSSSL